MSLAFAEKRGFKIKKDLVHQVRFADNSVQDVESKRPLFLSLFPLEMVKHHNCS